MYTILISLYTIQCIVYSVYSVYTLISSMGKTTFFWPKAPSSFHNRAQPAFGSSGCRPQRPQSKKISASHWLKKNLCFSLVEKVPVVAGGTISQAHRGMVELSEGFAKQKTRLLATKPEHMTLVAAAASKKNVARIANAVPCHSLLRGHHEF